MVGLGTEVAFGRRDGAAVDGFTLLSRCDLDTAFAGQPGTAYGRGTILRLCHPARVHRTIIARPDMWLRRCQTVAEIPAATWAELIDPSPLAGMDDTPDIAELAPDAGVRPDLVVKTQRKD